MGVDVREVKGVLVVHPDLKRVTAASGAEEFRSTIDDAVTKGRLAIALDLAGIEYADSTMIGVLIAAFKSLNQNGGLICAYNVGPELHEFFRQTVLDRLIEVCKSEDDALDLFKDRSKSKKKGLRGLFS